MIQEISIKSAELKIIKSSPSTLGNIDVFLVIYDNEINGIGDYIEENELIIADELFEQCQFENFFVIHTTTPYRGEKIRPIKNVKTKFSINRINC